VLFIAWDGSYLTVLRQTTSEWWHAVREDHAYGWFLPTLFLHAGPRHLIANMTSLLAGSSAVGVLAGGRWALASCRVTGLGAAWASYAGHGAPPLSVGASGAIFGLLGCTVSFIIRRRHLFNYRQRWKVWRVYVPMFVVLFLPALGNADVHAHAGGLASGLLLGLLIPPHERVAQLAAVDPMAEDEPANHEVDEDPADHGTNADPI
jgi:membrane associated rhomboid family serine protease